MKILNIIVIIFLEMFTTTVTQVKKDKQKLQPNKYEFKPQELGWFNIKNTLKRAGANVV